MERKMKRLLSLVLAVMMVFSMMPQITLGAKADDSIGTVYFDNSSVQWDVVYVFFADENQSSIGNTIAMTKLEDGALWSAEVPEGTEFVYFGGNGVGFEVVERYEDGRTYTLTYFGHDKLYLYASEAFLTMYFGSTEGTLSVFCYMVH